MIEIFTGITQLEGRIDDLATGPSTKSSPDVEIDVRTDEVDGTVASERMNSSRVAAIRRNLHCHVCHRANKTGSRTTIRVRHGNVVVLRTTVFPHHPTIAPLARQRSVCRRIDRLAGLVSICQ